jgi:CHAD domain-containing protein
MAFRIRQGESIAHGLRRLAKKQLASARDCLDGGKSPHESAVHAARKSVKKVRAIVHLVRSDDGQRLSKSRKRLREANRVLSQSRDADAMTETLSTLLDREPRVLSEHTRARLHRQLAEHRDTLARAAADGGTWKDVADELHAIRKTVKRWSQSHDGFGAMAPGLRETHKLGGKAMGRAVDRDDADDFHEWRKEIKALWYELRLLEEFSPGVKRYVEQLGRAETALGDDHNIAVLCAFLGESRAVAGEAVAMRQFLRQADRYQQELRLAAVANTKAIYEMATGDFVRRVRQAWRDRRTNRETRRPATGASKAARQL